MGIAFCSMVGAIGVCDLGQEGTRYMREGVEIDPPDADTTYQYRSKGERMAQDVRGCEIFCI